MLALSEYLTFPLFAMLVGVGAQLGARAHGARRHLVSTCVHAVALLGLGWLLDQAGAQVIIVLAPLGVLTLLMWFIVRLPTWAVAAVGATAAALAPWVAESTEPVRTRLMMEQSPALWWFELLASDSYPQIVLVLMACAGVLLTRLLLPATGVRRVPAAVAAVVFLALAAAWRVADLVGVVDLIAYETVWPVLAFDLCLAAALVAGCLVIGAMDQGGVRALVRTVADAGSMTLTLYALHVVWLAWWVRVLRPALSDDAWLNVVGMTVGALVLAAVWTRLPWPARWRRGPVEGMLAQTVAALEGRRASA